MHVVSLFPALLSYQQLGPLVIRLVVGVTLAYFGWRKMNGHGHSSGSNTKTYGAVEVLIALFLVIGLYTQLAALLNAIILLIKLGFKAREGKLFSDGINYYVLLLAMALSLVVTGPGAFAVDYPL